MIILASKSPRRKELLSYAVRGFEIIPAESEEVVPVGTRAEDVPLVLARQKAFEVAAKHPNDTVIGADTVVICGGEIFGKPKDAADAKRMLKALSGTLHKVVTGVCCINGSREESFSVTTAVEFFVLSDGDIDAYIATGEPFDKAGAYGIQGKGCLLVKRIDGDYYNVMGLPVGELNERLRRAELI